MSETEREKLPAARYQGRARPQMAFGNASTGSLQVAVTIDLVNEGYDDRRVTWFGSFANEEAEDITIRSLRDMGWKGTDFDDPTGLGDVDVAVVVKYDTWQGKERMKIDIWPLAGSAFKFEKPAPKTELAALANRLKGKLHMTAKQAARPAAGGQRPAAPAWQPPATNGTAPVREWDGTGPDPDGEPLRY